MTTSKVKPRWAPRVPQARLRRLYETAATGRLDEELLADVGLALYLRCRSILTVRDIRKERRLPCPSCGQAVPLGAGWTGADLAYPLRCDGCGGDLPWGDYWGTFRHQELGPGGAVEMFAEYLSDWEAARTSDQKLLAVDRVIHRWHWEDAATPPPFGLGRQTGVNLIEGNRRDVIAFLDQLSYGAASPPDTAATRDAWRARHDEVRARKAKWKAARAEKHDRSDQRSQDCRLQHERVQ